MRHRLNSIILIIIIAQFISVNTAKYHNISVDHVIELIHDIYMGHAHGPFAEQNQQTAAGTVTLSVLFYRCQVAIIVHMLPEQLSHCLNNY